MFHIKNIFARKCLFGILLLNTLNVLAQTDSIATVRLDNFMLENCKRTYTEITVPAVQKILKHKAYHIELETHNLYGDKTQRTNEFIVIDTDSLVTTFETIKETTQLPKLTSYIKEDFVLNEQSAPDFESLLDQIYPLPDWKPDKREFFFKNGKWYFLRDGYFRTKQGFEISIDSTGRIVDICYKMKWEETESR
ncbi:hypothetical protein [Flagellimonas zhangzhouensis]|uniref:Uncharacterized protein n=1 Tax=Flagellimonas zhangzhouensis TaxID=1073328 RepID=A0A1H2VP83_9FLAO|nr:hypothetical protein [Allomuricauda zhangzhouensis]SDQ06542.1 hypothetical protein SAMN05216294_0128 [Allomuricauda zhangzhouensis]SDW70123.1 hypothetical protein SAMN04487892_2165 [Allomuricauda zhangzhouensis]